MKRMDKDKRPSLKPVQGEMVAVNGMNLKTFGYCNFDISLKKDILILERPLLQSLI